MPTLAARCALKADLRGERAILVKCTQYKMVTSTVASVTNTQSQLLRWRRNTFRMRRGSDQFVLGVFAEDGTLAAQVGFERAARSKSRHKGTLIGMYVVPEFRGRGLGKQLVAALIAEARARAGMEQINLTVTHRNAEARALYLKAGFVPFGVEKNALKVDGTYYDKEYMALTL